MIGSIFNGVREPILFSLSVNKHPGLERYKEPEVNFFRNLNKSALSHISFCFEDDDSKPVDVNNETKKNFSFQPTYID